MNSNVYVSFSGFFLPVAKTVCSVLICNFAPFFEVALRAKEWTKADPPKLLGKIPGPRSEGGEQFLMRRGVIRFQQFDFGFTFGQFNRLCFRSGPTCRPRGDQ